MLRIGICDDSREERERILAAAKAYFEGSREYAVYSTFDSAFRLLEDVEKGTVFDILLLDICMPGIKGTEAAKELRDGKNPAEIIFLTTSDDFAVDAFAVKATDYVVKPFTQRQFNRAMDRAVLHIRQRQSAKLVFRLVGGGIQVENISRILFFKNDGHILLVYLTDGDVLRTRMAAQDMKAALERIVPGQFQSPNKGYLVNLEHVHRIQSDGVEVGGHQLPLGRRKFRDFEKLYFAFMFRP